MKLFLSILAIIGLCLSAWAREDLSDTNTPSPKEIETTRLAAESGDADSQYMLGNYYYRGQGVATNRSAAVTWFQKSAEQGNIWAQCCLGLCYQSGEGVVADKAKAVAWFSKAADQGYPNGQYDLGLCYAQGDGVVADPKEALKWFYLAGQYGEVAEGNFAVARCLYDGAGIKQDRSQAVSWYEKAAEQNLLEAQMLAGMSYWFGWDVKADQPKAVEWFRRAANQGEPQAFVFLSPAYYNVKGLKTNYVEAYKWTLLAREFVDPGLTNELVKLKRKLMPWQVWKAQRQVKEFKAKQTIKPLLGYAINTTNAYLMATLAQAYRKQDQSPTIDQLMTANPYFMSRTNFGVPQP